MASYQYEQLNDESFQQLSQSLLVREFPGLQCFPVGQPDGGRDAIVRYEGARKATGFILFQVKFARHELSPPEARDWLLRTLRHELPKVRKQMEKGAEHFVLVTNVPGTAHHEAGSIDKLQALLKELIPIPAQAWWRGDLDRRLDDAWDLKFTYPALFSGTDLLRLVIEASPSEGRERRRNAITAFLSHQLESEREVKFKQAELESDIFDLFTDVPLVPRNPAGRRQRAAGLLAAAFGRAANSASGEVDPFWVHQLLEIALEGERSFGSFYSREETWMGAASLLLDSDFQQAEPLVILEGAPGQGKSTIAQYICQVHRIRILAHQQASSVASAYLDSSLRLPFKVELRDFATWLSGGNPFGSVSGGDSTDSSPRSLEAFLSALVRYASGGSDFDVSDLHATLSASSALIVLDGLDEVAEVKQRQRVVDEITSAVPRLKSVAASLQVVVTSRPTPFTNSPVLPRRTFATYSLESLTRPLITEYAERWLHSRAVDDTDASEARQILKDKLDEPHLRDLARNPMQLAILLSLIHRRGVSLPDKRTALYDSYVEMFFDRESEKATVVKENRDLLIRIHRYLAWVLQSGAEITSEPTSRVRPSGISLSGTIAEDDLKALVRDFLERDGSDLTLVEKLFSGMVERVVAIVSRVQGLYEFDVQTLREYFAARHLYQTAPYSPTGHERRGTISDRWRSLSRNYYWLNVARFYAGCYSEGELPSLVEDLRDLTKDEVFGRTSHPQLLAATLLSDWVFSQRPRAIKDAVDILLEPRGLRMLVAGAGSGLSQVEDVIVGDPSGRDRLIAACKELVGPNQPIEQVMDIVRSVLRPNSRAEELLDWWIEELGSADETQAKHWCVLGELLQCWSVVDLGTVSDLLSRKEVPSSSVITGLLHADRMDVFESAEELFEAAVDAVLAGERVRYRGSSILQRLAWLIDRTSYRTSLGRHDPRGASATRISLREYLSRFRGYKAYDKDITLPSYPTAQRCARLVEAFTSAADRPLAEWNTSIEPWDRFVQQGISDFGVRPRFVELANLAAGIRSTEEKCQDSPDLFDAGRPMVRRARYARLRAGSRKWWSEQLRAANNADEVQMALLLFATWAGARTVEQLAQAFDKLVAGLGTSQWRSLYASLRRAVGANTVRSWIKPLGIHVSAMPPSLSARTVALLAERCTHATVDELYERYLTNYKGDDSIMVSLSADVQVRRALGDETKWAQAIEGLRASYSLGVLTSRGLLPHMRRTLTLPDTVARQVVDKPLEFPTALVGVAEARCRQLDAASILPVGQVADDDDWFTE